MATMATIKEMPEKANTKSGAKKEAARMTAAPHLYPPIVSGRGQHNDVSMDNGEPVPSIHRRPNNSVGLLGRLARMNVDA